MKSVYEMLRWISKMMEWRKCKDVCNDPWLINMLALACMRTEYITTYFKIVVSLKINYRKI